MRITILGLPGSGKSTLAQKIAQKKHIPYIHIDRFWLEGGGGQNSRTTPDPEKTYAHVISEVLKAIQTESWVSDGVYSGVQSKIAERADVVVFLDIPLWRRLLNHAERMMRPEKRHKEVSFWGDLGFFLEMIGRDLRKSSKIKKILDMYPDKTIILRSRTDIQKYLQALP